MNINVKICGVKTVEIAEQTSKLGADMIGVVFYEKSPRNTDFQTAKQIQNSLPATTKLVAVTVNPTDDFLTEMLKNFKPDFIQLHGSETPERAFEIKNKFGLNIIKAISVAAVDDLKKADEFAEFAEYILFDAKPPQGSVLPGGNAVSFDWNILNNHQPNYKWILSGGLNLNNVIDAVNTSKTNFIDISSGVESAIGEKNLTLIKELLKILKK